MQINVSYPTLPKVPSSHASLVMDHFGLTFDTAEHVVARDLHLPIEPGQIVAFTGPSGSGKSSLLRTAAAELDGVINAATIELPDTLVCDALGLPFEKAVELLSLVGLSEPRLMLRTPAELSDGQRFRFRIAAAFAQKPQWIVIDEFTATLDRTLAKVIAFNVRRLSEKQGIGFLVATTHEDIAEDLTPDLHVRCDLDGEPVISTNLETNSELIAATASRHSRPSIHEGDRTRAPRGAGCSKRISFADRCVITTGSRLDWPYFTRWHYRSHNLGSVRFVTVLWHDDRPIGICVFASPPLSLAQRNRFFRRKSRWSRLGLRVLNRQLVHLSRVVLHPTYRGAGLAAAFVRQSCEAVPFPWVETLAAMGNINPLFERAGFTRVGSSTTTNSDRRRHSAIYGSPTKRHGPASKQKRLLSQESHIKSRFAAPVYYVFDNRSEFERRRSAGRTAE
ncbi:ATP-binding cassette domain-containing protein [Stratiformator vulcanicus]|uniref:Lipoprotein-releasing system ATP-binding protein LolD n=1 Tax=Stratiformator vulcanicus TaxID=2527980 RepID=A0A517QWZ2_9PLAN|nr:ATP-binding cassette domain-containing protein [Stratiformator vulcanicus]QDT36114.1 Lipoprotein-releasing system ATP-binding protein LolD [Stratiformator vulcanicus]